MIAASGRFLWERRVMPLTIGLGLLALAIGSVVAVTKPELVIGIAAAGAAVMIAFVSPASGLRILMISAMAGGLSAETSFGNLRLDQAVVLPIFAGVIGRRLVDRQARSSGSRVAPLIFFAAAYLAMNLVTSLVVAPVPLLSLRIVLWLGLSGLALLVTILVIPLYIDGRRALVELTAIGAAAALLGAVTYFLGIAGILTFGTQVDPVSGALSAKGTFLEANILGSFSAAMTVLAVGLAVFDEGLSRRARLWMVSFAIVSAVACLSSLTRAAWLGVAVGFAVEAVIGFRAFPRPKMAGRAVTAGVALSGVIVLLGLAPTLLDRTSSLLTDSTGSVAFRLERYRLALNEWSHAPLIGLGTNSFGQRHLDPTQGFRPDYLGGLGIATLYDVGVLGMVFLGAIFLVLGARLLRSLSRRSDPSIRAAAVAGFGAVGSLLVSYQATNAF